MTSIALKYIDQNERIILNNSNGAVIAYLGSTENAMFIASDMRDEILKINANISSNLNLRVGIHLDHVKAEKKIDGQSNIIAIGINAAKRIMNSAKPNETLVSRSYFENTPESTQRVVKMYDESIDNGIDYESNREASLVDGVDGVENNAITELQTYISPNNLLSLNNSVFVNRINWKYALTTIVILITIFLLIKLTTIPHQSNIPIQRGLKVDSGKVAINLPIELKKDKYDERIQENLEQQKSVKVEPVKNKTKSKKYKSRESNPKMKKPKEKSVWKSLIANVKQGQKNKCTQSEIAMRQCN